MKLISLVLCLNLCLAITAYGDMVWVRDTNQPLSGQVVSQSDEKVEFKPFSDGKFGPAKSIPISQIQTIVVNIDQDRLASLSPNDPAAYRNYAEELSSQQADSCAINLARRLYLLAAVNSNKKLQDDLRSGALLGLISLTPEGKQRRQLEMYYRLSAPNSRSLKPITSPPIWELPTESEKRLMLQVVGSIRRENPTVALELLRSPRHQKSLEKWNRVCSLDELTQIALADYPSRQQLGRLLAVESTARQDETNQSDYSPSKETWGELAMEPSSELNVLPSMDNITQFDPEKSVYRNGVWVRP